MNMTLVYCPHKFNPKNFCPPVQVAHTQTPITLPQGPYTYLGKGKQAVAFESQDKKHVIKLFYWKKPLHKQWYLSAENWIRVISPLWTVKFLKKKPQITQLFTRYVWGMEDLAEDVALETIHFQPTKDPLWITLVDAQRHYHVINLAKYPFLIQKKVVLLGDYLNHALATEGVEKGQEAIDLLCDYFNRRISMGYCDNPVVFEKNYGFLEGRPRQIDIGKLEKKPASELDSEKAKVMRNLQHYLLKKYPMLKLDFEP